MHPKEKGKETYVRTRALYMYVRMLDDNINFYLAKVLDQWLLLGRRKVPGGAAMVGVVQLVFLVDLLDADVVADEEAADTPLVAHAQHLLQDADVVGVTDGTHGLVQQQHARFGLDQPAQQRDALQLSARRFAHFLVAKLLSVDHLVGIRV